MTRGELLLRAVIFRLSVRALDFFGSKVPLVGNHRTTMQVRFVTASFGRADDQLHSLTGSELAAPRRTGWKESMGWVWRWAGNEDHSILKSFYPLHVSSDMSRCPKWDQEGRLARRGQWAGRDAYSEFPLNGESLK